MAIPIVVGMVWYKEDQYDRIRESCEDGSNLPKTFAEWLSKANEGVEYFKSQGKTIRKVTLDIDEFLAFCRERNCKVDSKARNAFVNNSLAISLGLKKG